MTMEAALSPDMLATDLAYHLVRKGVSPSIHLPIVYRFCVSIELNEI